MECAAVPGDPAAVAESQRALVQELGTLEILLPQEPDPAAQMVPRGVAFQGWVVTGGGDLREARLTVFAGRGRFAPFQQKGALYVQGVRNGVENGGGGW